MTWKHHVKLRKSMFNFLLMVEKLLGWTTYMSKSIYMISLLRQYITLLFIMLMINTSPHFCFKISFLHYQSTDKYINGEVIQVIIHGEKKKLT